MFSDAADGTAILARIEALWESPEAMAHQTTLQPYDSFNQVLEANVHPRDWVNPKPSGRYNLVVIGGGTAGLVAAMGAAGLGARVALIERGLLGGDCLNVGCVPSKALISSGRAAAWVRDAPRFGVRPGQSAEVDFSEVMERMRRLRSSISPHDSARRFTEAGIDVFLGQGSFVGRNSIEVGDARLEFKKAVIATGGRAAKLSVPGAEEMEVLTNESIFSLTRLPRRLIVIGGGPIGCEMAQSFARFGSQVTLIEKSAGVLPRDDADAGTILQREMSHDGVKFEFSCNVVRLEQVDSKKVVVVRRHDREFSIEGDAILVAAGRIPNVEGMGLELAGVRYDLRHGVEVNERLQSSNRNIYAAGDVASRYRFTHAADFMARLVIRNALFLGRERVSDLLIPWSTYTSPEVAHVGITPQQVSDAPDRITTLTIQLSEVDRAILDGETNGFVRVYLRRGSDRLLGATVVGAHAGDMISELTLAMKHQIGLKQIASTIHPYPTQAEAIRKLGDQYNRTRLTPTVASVMRRWLAWTR